MQSETKQRDKNLLGTAPIGKLLFKLAVPSVIAQIVNLLYNMVDRIYIGHYDPSGLALTGVGICMPIIMAVSAFAALVGMGGAPNASIAMGQKDNARAEKIMGNCLSFLILLSVILTVLVSVWCRPLLLAFGASENTIDAAVEYMQIYAIGTLFVQFALGMNAFITAQGFTTVSMLSVLIGAVLNIVLDPVFIFLFHMGVRGAALATIISQAVSAIWVVWFLCSKRSTLRLKLKNLRIVPKILLPCLFLGVSPFIMQITESVLSVCFNTSLLKYGGDIAVGSMTILSTLMQFCMLPLNGLTQGAQPITSFNFGAQKYTRVRRSFKLLLISCLVYSTLLWALVMLFPSMFVRMFNSNPALIEYASSAMRVYFAICALFGIQIACQQTLIAIGNAKTSVFLAIFRKLILLIPFIYILPLLFENKAFAVFLAEPVSDFIAVTTTAILFTIYFKKAVPKTDQSLAEK